MTDVLIEHLKSERVVALTEARGVLQKGLKSTSDGARLEGALMDAERAQERIERFSSAVQVVNEPLVYEAHSPHSYFTDLYWARYGGNEAAKRRLARHAQQMSVELPRLERLRSDELARRGGELGGVTVERRALGNTGNAGGSGQEFTPPLWLMDKWAGVPRAAAPLAAACTTLPLPGGISQVSVPLFTSDPGVAIQTTQNTALLDASGMTTASVTSGVSTFAGRAVVSEQLRNQSGQGTGAIDEAIFADLTASAYEQLEIQLINGTGSGSQLRGLLNVTGTTSTAFTSATPTGTGFLTSLAQNASLTSTTRKRLVTMILMHPRRYFWLASQLDNSGRPLIEPGDGPLMGIGDAGPVGPFFAAVPGYLTTAMPTTLGASTNQDPVIVTRPVDHLLLTSTPDTVVDAEAYADSLGLLFRLVFSAAFLGNRWPTATGVLNGTGQVAPAGF